MDWGAPKYKSVGIPQTGGPSWWVGAQSFKKKCLYDKYACKSILMSMHPAVSLHFLKQSSNSPLHQWYSPHHSLFFLSIFSGVATPGGVTFQERWVGLGRWMGGGCRLPKWPGNCTFGCGCWEGLFLAQLTQSSGCKPEIYGHTQHTHEQKRSLHTVDSYSAHVFK